MPCPADMAIAADGMTGAQVGFQNKVFGVLACVTALGSAVPVSSASGVDVTISITNLRNMKGQVLVCLTTNPKAFPDCSKDAASLKKVVVTSSASTVIFSDVPAGTYAIALVHDENKDGKLNAPVLIPTEGFGFSRNPTVTFGPPSFKKASFVVGASDVSQTVKMKYML